MLARLACSAISEPQLIWIASSSAVSAAGTRFMVALVEPAAAMS